MGQYHQLVLLILIVNCSLYSCRVRVWMQRTNLREASNWNDNQIPCESDTVLFPEQSYDIIKVSNFDVKEIILPKTGGFVFDTEAKLNFHERDSKCNSNEIKTFKRNIEIPWLSIDNWGIINDSKYENDNKATPHEELVPCDNDEVIFPINNSFVINLQSIPIIMFKSLAIEGRVLTIHEFKEFLMSPFGQLTFKNTDNVMLLESTCNDENKCACHEHGVFLLDQLCENLQSNCQVPHCSDPIKPIGHCCSVCGAMLHMSLAAVNNFRLKNFKVDIAKAIAATSIVDTANIFHHVSIVKKDKQLFLQLIIIDKADYNEQSTKLLQFLQKNKLKEVFENQSKLYFFSGMPLSPNESSHVFTFIFGTFFMVSLFMTVIYVFYYDDTNIPRLMATIRNRQFLPHTDVIFARFDNTTTNLIEREEEVDLHFGTDQSIENLNTAFNNPMFDQHVVDPKENLVQVELREE